jgi:hypothetical protein
MLFSLDNNFLSLKVSLQIIEISVSSISLPSADIIANSHARPDDRSDGNYTACPAYAGNSHELN